MHARKHIAIIGGGPAGLMAADVLASFHTVHVYDHSRSVGRKFLVAGQGGFNLTNSADGPDLISRYTPPGFLDRALARFGSDALRAWLKERGIETYVGSSGRVFPIVGIKPIDVLNAIVGRLVDRDVRFHRGSAFVGFDERARAIIETNGVRTPIDADITIFALGGASWSVTGSKGTWPEAFDSIGIRTQPFQASNCGVVLSWPEAFARDHAGKALKNIRITAGGLSALGEATITRNGLEGNAVYPVVPALRDAMHAQEVAHLRIDFKPNNTADDLLHHIAGKAQRNVAEALNLDRASLALIKAFTTRECFLTPRSFVEAVQDLRLPITALRPLDEAISTVGGIRTTDLAPDLSLLRYPQLFTIGEMVDWDAPTGGFLLQGCFAMGHHAARAILAR